MPDPKCHWNYRVIEQVDETGEKWRGFHEVHYEDGEPYGYSSSPCSPIWDPDENPNGGEEVLAMMRLALGKPVLTPEDFGEGPTNGGKDELQGPVPKSPD